MSDFDPDDDAQDWWRVVSQEDLDRMADAIAVDDFKAALLPGLLKTSGGGGRVPAQLDHGVDQGHDEQSGPRPDRSQGQSRPLGGGEPADDLAAAMARALGHYH